MEPWREELYASDYGGYYLAHRGRTKGVKNGEGKVYGFRSHTRHAEGRMARAEKENVKGNGRGMEDFGKAAIGIGAGLATAGAAAGTIAAISNRNRVKSDLSNKSTAELIRDVNMTTGNYAPDDYGGKYESQGNRATQSSPKGNNQQQKQQKSPEELAKGITTAAREASSGMMTTYGGVDQLISATKKSKIDLSGYSNKELQDIVTRANLESAYLRVANAESSRRKDAVNGALTAIGGTLTTAASVLTAVILIKQLKDGGKK